MDLSLSPLPAPTTELSLLVACTGAPEKSFQVAKLLPGHVPTWAVTFALGDVDDLVSSGGFTLAVQPTYHVPTNCLHLSLTGSCYAYAAGHVAGLLAEQGWTLRTRQGCNQTLAELARAYAGAKSLVSA